MPLPNVRKLKLKLLTKGIDAISPEIGAFLAQACAQPEPLEWGDTDGQRIIQREVRVALETDDGSN